MDEMLQFFFDTSAIVKRYHQELGSDIVDRIFESILNKRSRSLEAQEWPLETLDG
ncbi:MAG: hypothetical protein QXG01_08360 [Candidatus Bathyarchaeia archaeon]